MKHVWQPYKPPNSLLAPPDRRCKHCKAVQRIQIEYEFGRIIRRQWWPLAGRCSGNDLESRKTVYFDFMGRYWSCKEIILKALMRDYKQLGYFSFEGFAVKELKRKPRGWIWKIE